MTIDGPRVSDRPTSGFWLQKERRAFNHCRRPLGRTSHEPASSIEIMGRTVLIAILMLAASHSAIGQNAHPSSTAFHWLNSSKDAALFERIKTTFADELKADDPEKVKPVVAQEYK
jgi:hypothetical protein